MATTPAGFLLRNSPFICSPNSAIPTPTAPQMPLLFQNPTLSPSNSTRRRINNNSSTNDMLVSPHFVLWTLNPKIPSKINPSNFAFPTVMDINQIRDILPHRFPFLLVDRVIEYNPGVSAVAIKNVTINDNFFPGHFPERPIMPGVLMVEAMAQVGGLVMLQPEVGGSRENFFFAGIDKVRFRKPVIAGDTLVMRMTLVKLQKRFGIAKMEGKAYVGGEVVCEGEFLMATGS
ncbi:hypothetical protein CUMW_282160 [Citrus unshiu]|uniref:3-hydroxyacyl-[acyl-carrier-protein] dehydratase n=1 Tax=Citrus unshiu TaxID=55188 RepID=A0A2H5N1E8_CITUN|nr:hypothetical protein CUMW_282160 [Citrus unshiu]